MEYIDKYRIKIDDALISKLNQNNWVDENIKDQNYFQKLLGVSNEMFEVYYSAAAHLLDSGRFEDARDAFLFLSFLNPFVHNVWMGAGISQQSLGKYEEACNAYYMAEILDPHDPYMHANNFQCLVALNEHASAAESLNLAIECCEDKSEFKELRDRLIPLKDMMKKVA